MYRISELAAQVGLSRTTLLYYEKRGLIQGRRLENGYRIYSDRDLQHLCLIQQLQAGGLTLNECKACLDAKIERRMLLNRLQLRGYFEERFLESQLRQHAPGSNPIRPSRPGLHGSRIQRHC